jgi:phosphoglycolate phosphatase
MSDRGFRNIIFDLDGTLIDSFPGIAESLSHAVSLVNPLLDLGDLKPHIGPPLPVMLSRMWPQHDEGVRGRVLMEFRADYNSRGCLFSVPYPGIPETLQQFHSSGITLFVLTNKPETPTRRILAHLGLEHHFREVISPDSQTPPLRSKPEGALLLARKHGLIATETLLVGDSQDDLKAAHAAGFQFLEASYGYGHFDENVTEKAWLRLKSPSDLAKVVSQSFSSP